jgi:hypothetical protein
MTPINGGKGTGKGEIRCSVKTGTGTIRVMKDAMNQGAIQASEKPL